MSENIKLNDDQKYNRASKLQLFLFSFNNLSTNFPYIVLSSYLLYYAQSYLMLSAVLVGWIITGMRLFDGITDPIIGMLIDRTDTKFGKFRPWMVVGNIIINVTFWIMFVTVDPEWSNSMKILVFLGFYIVHIIGYSMQTASTKGGGTIITSDPSQRPILAFYYGAVGMVIMVAFMSYIPVAAGKFELNMLDPMFWRHIAVIAVICSFLSMILAVIGIWKKDVPENYRGFSSEKVRIRDFVGIIRGNRAIAMLVVAGAVDKLAFSLTGAVEIYMYSNILLNQDLAGFVGLISLPVIILFTIFGTKVGQKFSQKQSFVITSWMCVILSFFCWIFWPEAGAQLTGISSVLFISCYVLRKGAIAVPGTFITTMISDCADYEMYLSGKAVPGIMGTLFSFVDKVVSSLNGVVIAGMFALFGLQNTVIEPLIPATDYSGLTAIIIVGVVIFPIVGYLASLLAMKYYPLDGEKMSEVRETIALYKENAVDPRHIQTMKEHEA